jgi:hypothetical protein
MNIVKDQMSKKKSSDFGILGPVFSCDLITTNNHNSLTLI